MTLYHVFLTYLDHTGNEQTFLQYNMTEERVRDEIVGPFQGKKGFFVIGYLIKPSNVLHLRIYRSEVAYEELRLPTGGSPLGQPHASVLYYLDSNLVPGVEICTDDFIVAVPLPEEPREQRVEAPATPRKPHIDHYSIQAHQRGYLRKRNILFFALCVFAYLGNIVFMGLLRWADASNQEFFAIVYQGSGIITFWTMASSVLIFLFLFTVTNYLLHKERSSTCIAAVNTGVLMALLLLNISTNFTLQPTEDVSTAYPVLVYAAPYMIMVAEIALTTYTLFYRYGHFLIREKELLYNEITRSLGPLIAAPFTIMIVGIVVTFLSHTITEWKMVFPVWFGHLLVGAFLWLIAVHMQLRELQWELATEYRVQIVEKKELPPLPSVTA